MKKPTTPPPSQPAPSWSLLSSHGQVLVCLVKDPAARLQDIASLVRLTPRAIQNVIRDLESEGVVERLKDGRRNRYLLNLDVETAGDFLDCRTYREILGYLSQTAPPHGDKVGSGRDG